MCLLIYIGSNTNLDIFSTLFSCLIFGIWFRGYIENILVILLGTANYKATEKLYVTFIKQALGVKSSTNTLLNPSWDGRSCRDCSKIPVQLTFKPVNRTCITLCSKK